MNSVDELVKFSNYLATLRDKGSVTTSTAMLAWLREGGLTKLQPGLEETLTKYITGTLPASRPILPGVRTPLVYDQPAAAGRGGAIAPLPTVERRGAIAALPVPIGVATQRAALGAPVRSFTEIPSPEQFAVPVEFEKGDLKHEHILNVTSTTTVAEAEQMYARRLGIPQRADLIRFKWAGTTLKQSDPVLKDKGKEWKHKILVPNQRVAVPYRVNKEQSELDVGLADSIAGVKRKMWLLTGYPPEQQRIYLNNIELRNDASLLAEYMKFGKTADVRIDLGPTPTESIAISIPQLGAAVPQIQIKQTTRIAELKRTIAPYIQNGAGGFEVMLGPTKVLANEDIVYASLAYYNRDKKSVSDWTPFTLAVRG
ncbi:Hypothetical protein POVN_LOCUS625 [uncultured virus]|nr:Hypothetical protein POVN_LOCUS625 [uncultured virus]